MDPFTTVEGSTTLWATLEELGIVAEEEDDKTELDFGVTEEDEVTLELLSFLIKI